MKKNKDGLINLPSSHLAPLQHIQNTAARLITRTRKHEHITPIIRSLHWLPLQQRIKFKILMLTYKAFHKIAPSYISALITPKNPYFIYASPIIIHSTSSSGPRPSHPHPLWKSCLFCLCPLTLEQSSP